MIIVVPQVTKVCPLSNPFLRVRLPHISNHLWTGLSFSGILMTILFLFFDALSITNYYPYVAIILVNSINLELLSRY